MSVKHPVNIVKVVAVFNPIIWPVESCFRPGDVINLS